MKYRLYVDEVGNSDLKSSDNPIHRFLSLTGVIIELDYVSKTLFPEIESLKSKYFDSHPDDPIILHRKEIVNAKYPFEALGALCIEGRKNPKGKVLSGARQGFREEVSINEEGPEKGPDGLNHPPPETWIDEVYKIDRRKSRENKC